MEIILVTWDDGEKIAYPYQADTLLKLTISYDCSSSQIQNIEIIQYHGSLYQPQDKIQELPFETNNNHNPNSTPNIINWMECLIEERIKELALGDSQELKGGE